MVMGNLDSRQNPDFHKGISGERGSCDNSIMQMSDAFSYNGIGAATPGRNQSTVDIYVDGAPKEKLFEQRGNADYYKMDPLAPDFIGCANKNRGLSIPGSGQ